MNRRLVGTTRESVSSDGPTCQEQPQNDAQNQLFLAGQAAHAHNHTMTEVGRQWQNVGWRSVDDNIDQLAGNDNDFPD